MNDSEKRKLEERLKKAAPLINQLSDDSFPVPDRVKSRLNAALEQRFPQSAEEQEREVEQVPVQEKTSPDVPKEPHPLMLAWRWWLSMAAATAAVALILALNQPNRMPLVQVAMLDSIGDTRGGGGKPLVLIKEQWKDSKPVEFSELGDLEKWEKDWPTDTKRPVVKIVFDRDIGELRITVWLDGKSQILKAIPVPEDKDLPKLLDDAHELVMEHFSK